MGYPVKMLYYVEYTYIEGTLKRIVTPRLGVTISHRPACVVFTGKVKIARSQNHVGLPAIVIY